MRSTDQTMPWRIAAISFVTLALAWAAGAATLVVRSAGPSAAAYPPGKVLQPSARLALKANDQVTLLDEHGTRTLRGPGSFAAVASAAADADGGTALAALVQQRGDRRVRIGAVRGVEGESTRPPNIWYVDTSRGGTMCIADAAKAVLWRTGGDQPAKSVIANPAGTDKATIDWSPGQSVQPWPATLPIAEGARYTIVTGTAAPVAIRLTLTGTPAADLPGLATTLIAKGCKTQLDQLVEASGAATRAGGN